MKLPKWNTGLVVFFMTLLLWAGLMIISYISK